VWEPRLVLHYLKSLDPIDPQYSYDFKNAQQQFLGETVYPKFRKLSGLYVSGMALPQAETIEIGSSQWLT